MPPSVCGEGATWPRVLLQGKVCCALGLGGVCVCVGQTGTQKCFLKNPRSFQSERPSCPNTSVLETGPSAVRSCRKPPSGEGLARAGRCHLGPGPCSCEATGQCGDTWAVGKGSGAFVASDSPPASAKTPGLGAGRGASESGVKNGLLYSFLFAYNSRAGRSAPSETLTDKQRGLQVSRGAGQGRPLWPFQTLLVFARASYSHSRH